MRNSETGEFELVLGNRQVLSGFFIVVVLFGVFFTMGYIVGRNSAPARGAQETASAAGSASGAQSDARPQPASSAPIAAPAANPAASEPVATAPPQTAAAAQTQAAASDTGTQPASQPAREPAAAAPAESPADAGAQAEGAPPAGRYLQVSAVRREVAEVVLKTLKEKNFPALLAPGPNDRVRVLVGPYTDAAALGRAKAELENAGFQPFVQKY